MADGTTERGPTIVEAIRADFPILGRTIHGKPLTYLDNAASAQKPRQVIDAMRQAYESEYANVHRGLHIRCPTWRPRTSRNARETVRRFLNARSSAEIIFTRNATEAINLAGAEFRRHGDWAKATRSCCRSWSIIPISFPGISTGSAEARSSDGRRSTMRAIFLLDEFTKLLGAAHQARRHHPYVQCSGHNRADEGDHPHRP